MLDIIEPPKGASLDTGVDETLNIQNYKMQKGDKLPNNFILVQKKFHRCQFRKQNVKLKGLNWRIIMYT